MHYDFNFILKVLMMMKNYSNRDGVSEGQFYQVLLYELDAIRKVKIDIFVSFSSY